MKTKGTTSLWEYPPYMQYPSYILHPPYILYSPWTFNTLTLVTLTDSSQAFLDSCEDGYKMAMAVDLGQNSLDTLTAPP